jgi:hypothetical protein
MPSTPFASPYATSPGGSIPPPETTPEEGTHDLWVFFWLALVNTAIIAGSCLVAFALFTAH